MKMVFIVLGLGVVKEAFIQDGKSHGVITMIDIKKDHYVETWRFHFEI
jgi:hypothetical protein